MEIEMSSNDRLAYLNYGTNNFSVLYDCKLVIFHSTKNGYPSSADVATLVVLFHKGYTFLTCFPKRVRRNLGFGKFLFENHDNVTYSAGLNIQCENGYIHKLLAEPVYLSD